jgi:hypothetical protein
MTIIDALGWVGSIEILAAFGLNSFQKIASNSVVFQVLNLTGGLLLIVNSIYHEAYPFTFINSVWVIISIAALIKIFGKKSK